MATPTPAVRVGTQEQPTQGGGAGTEREPQGAREAVQRTGQHHECSALSRRLSRANPHTDATRPAVLTQVLGIVYRAISTFLIRRAGLRVGAGARTGAVTLVQRFGSALNLNPHLHMLCVDGAYAFDDKAPRFHRVAAPTQAELQRLLHAIPTRTTRALENQGL